MKGETQRRDWKSDSPFVALVFKQTADKIGKHSPDTAQNGGLARALIPAPSRKPSLSFPHLINGETPSNCKAPCLSIAALC